MQWDDIFVLRQEATVLWLIPSRGTVWREISNPGMVKYQISTDRLSNIENIPCQTFPFGKLVKYLIINITLEITAYHISSSSSPPSPSSNLLPQVVCPTQCLPFQIPAKVSGVPQVAFLFGSSLQTDVLVLPRFSQKLKLEYLYLHVWP